MAGRASPPYAHCSVLYGRVARSATATQVARVVSVLGTQPGDVLATSPTRSHEHDESAFSHLCPARWAPRVQAIRSSPPAALLPPSAPRAGHRDASTTRPSRDIGRWRDITLSRARPLVRYPAPHPACRSRVNRRFRPVRGASFRLRRPRTLNGRRACARLAFQRTDGDGARRWCPPPSRDAPSPTACVSRPQATPPSCPLRTLRLLPPELARVGASARCPPPPRATASLGLRPGVPCVSAVHRRPSRAPPPRPRPSHHARAPDALSPAPAPQGRPSCAGRGRAQRAQRRVPTAEAHVMTEARDA